VSSYTSNPSLFQSIQEDPARHCRNPWQSGGCYDHRCSNHCRRRWAWKQSSIVTRYLDASPSSRTVLAVTLAVHEDHLTLAEHRAILTRFRTKMGREPGYIFVLEVGPGGGFHYHGFVISDDLDNTALASAVRKSWSESCGGQSATASIGLIKTTTERAVGYAFGRSGHKRGVPIPLFKKIKDGGPSRITITSRFYRGVTAAGLWTDWKLERYGPKLERPAPARSWRPSNDGDAILPEQAPDQRRAFRPRSGEPVETENPSHSERSSRHAKVIRQRSVDKSGSGPKVVTASGERQAPDLGSSHRAGRSGPYRSGTTASSRYRREQHPARPTRTVQVGGGGGQRDDPTNPRRVLGDRLESRRDRFRQGEPSPPLRPAVVTRWLEREPKRRCGLQPTGGRYRPP